MKKLTLLFILILSLMVISSCEKNPGAESTTESMEVSTVEVAQEEPLKLDVADYPRVDGSTATIPLSISTYMTLTGASQEAAEANIIHTKTANAYTRLIAKEVDLLIVYEAPDTIKEVLKNSVVKLKIEPVGKDALVFITNKENPVTSLSSQQLIDIYSGKIVNWNEVGGSTVDLIPFQRPDDSGSQTLMKGLVMKDIPFVDAPSFLKPEMMGELIDRLVEYDNTSNALGYSVYYYAKNMYDQPNLKFLEVNEIAPSNQTIQDGSYPYVKDFYVVMREDEEKDSSSYAVFEWLLSESGQQLVTENGYVSIR